jgi:hypothetical protein
VPEFPLPPPKASAFDEISRELLAGGRPHPLLRDADSALSSAFRRCGYGEKTYYAVRGGFAMASRIEQINTDGTPSTNRWSIEVIPVQRFSLNAYIAALFRARPGHYRVIVFVLTMQPFEQKSTKVTSEEASKWVSGGLNKLPKEIGDRDYSADYTCTALIYEFKQIGGGEAEFVDPSGMPGRTHLERSGLWTALERRR